MRKSVLLDSVLERTATLSGLHNLLDVIVLENMTLRRRTLRLLENISHYSTFLLRVNDFLAVTSIALLHRSHRSGPSLFGTGLKGLANHEVKDRLLLFVHGIVDIL
ncbi:hypothetical protein KC614_03745, partial [candidate division WWE3 bacterium]|nr:hypothetical protein [candidate division WWE3 bacterium]